MEVPSDEVKNAVFDLFDRDDNNVVVARMKSIEKL